MISTSPVLTALFYGLVSAATLPIGAAIGVLWRPPDRVMAFLLAFGGGALLAALTIDLVAPGVDRGHYHDLAVGALMGGLLFKALDYLINRRGGYLRKPSTAMTYWRRKARDRLQQVLSDLHRIRPFGRLSPEANEGILGILLVQEFPAGSCLYRADDPAENLYIIEEGRVDLSDPQRSGRVFEHLGKHDVFGRMSFICGLRRATEAYAVTAVKLLVIPREGFMELVGELEDLRDMLCERIGEEEVTRYLYERQGLTIEQASAWQRQAMAALSRTGHYTPPLVKDPPEIDLTDLLRDEPRVGLFAELPERELQQVASRLVHGKRPAGFDFFQPGQQADRCWLLRKGSVYLFDPSDRSREPVVIRPGQVFGGLSFFTGETHATTAVGFEPTEVSMLRRKDFGELLDRLPRLRHTLSAYLRRRQVADYLTGQHNLDAGKAARWLNKAAKGVEGGSIFPSLAEMTRQMAGHTGAAMAVFLGIMLDGIPESLVIGANVLTHGGISMSLIGGLFLSNLPEALSSAAGMKEQGTRTARVLGMWTGLMLMTGLGAALGTVLLERAPETLFAFIEGIAAGAMLTVVAETMLPEAFHKGGGIVGISTLCGFLTAVFFNAPG
jgi:CRP-like cAMP-binding protein